MSLRPYDMVRASRALSRERLLQFQGGRDARATRRLPQGATSMKYPLYAIIIVFFPGFLGAQSSIDSLSKTRRSQALAALHD